MGAVVSSGMEKVVQKQMDYQQQFGKLQLERQIEMQNQMRIRMQALAIARSRDLFNFVGTFYGLLALSLTAGAIKKKNPALILPLIPLSVGPAYTYDMAWGNKMPRIVGWAEQIMADEIGLLGSPNGMPSVTDIDETLNARKKK